MQQSLENVISKLQKMYQLKAIELERINEELELRKIATALVNFKDIADISKYDNEKIKLFLNSIENTLDVGSVVLACSVVSFATPAVKNGKRYVDALKVLERLKIIASRFLSDKGDLFLKQTQCEKTLETMEALFYVLTNKVVVEDEKLATFINLLETELFNDDKYAVLVVVAALVIRNANLLANPSKMTKPHIEDIKIADVILTGKQEERKHELFSYVKSKEPLYASKSRGVVTNTYLRNLELLIEKRKATLDEIRNMLNTNSNLYEYFLWSWMNRLVNKLNGTDEKDIDKILDKLDELKGKLEDVLERKKISEVVKADIKNNRTIVYNLNNGIATSFNPKVVTKETVVLIEQLKLGKDTKSVSNVTTLENGLLLITGDSEFILFKKLVNNHTLLLLNGKIVEMDRKLESKLLSRLASSEFYSEKNKIIMEHGFEYRKLVNESKLLEEKFPRVKKVDDK